MLCLLICQYKATKIPSSDVYDYSKQNQTFARYWWPAVSWGFDFSGRWMPLPLAAHNIARHADLPLVPASIILPLQFGYFFTCVCLSNRLLKTLWIDYDEMFLEETNWLDFGNNRDYDLDPGIF